MDNCVFCKLLATQSQRLQRRNKNWWWKFDIHPVSPGHMLVIPKRHFKSLDDMKSGEWFGLFFAIEQAKREILDTDLHALYRHMVLEAATSNSRAFAKKMLEQRRFTAIPDFNLGLNDGKAAGQTVDHLHFHIIPRHEGDVENTLGGVRNVIAGMGNYWTPRE